MTNQILYLQSLDIRQGDFLISFNFQRAKIICRKKVEKNIGSNRILVKENFYVYSTAEIIMISVFCCS